VQDEAALQRAAELRAVDEGLMLQDWHEMRRGVGDDIVMMLDPATHIPGCEVECSNADRQPEPDDLRDGGGFMNAVVEAIEDAKTKKAEQ